MTAAQEREIRDSDKPGYPLPIDPVSGWAWWRFNLVLCESLPGYSAWQKPQSIPDLIPKIRWLVYGPISRPVDTAGNES